VVLLASTHHGHMYVQQLDCAASQIGSGFVPDLSTIRQSLDGLYDTRTKAVLPLAREFYGEVK